MYSFRFSMIRQVVETRQNPLFNKYDNVRFSVSNWSRYSMQVFNSMRIITVCPSDQISFMHCIFMRHKRLMSGTNYELKCQDDVLRGCFFAALNNEIDASIRIDIKRFEYSWCIKVLYQNVSNISKDQNYCNCTKYSI